jgi:cyclopropane fatty-acyl-phospholipid synthase-like methyltransferase
VIGARLGATWFVVATTRCHMPIDRISGSRTSTAQRRRRPTEAGIDELASHLAPGAHVLDLGCGAGVPADRLLVDDGFEVTGVDISHVQVDRARVPVPQATVGHTLVLARRP